MEKIDNLIKGKGLHIALIMLTFFVIYRVFVIGSIHSERELPIEVDDAYVYISQAHMFYNDYDRTKETTSSIQSIAKQTFENDTSNNVQNVSRYFGWASNKTYYLYSAAFGFFTEVLDIDPVKVWWAFAYVVQFLVAISVILMISLYFGTNRIPLIVASILCIFISLEIVHQITATPLTIANALLLIGWFFLNKAKKSKLLWLVGGAIVTSALHVHPGAFVVFGLLSFSSLVCWCLDRVNNFHHRNIFFFSIAIVSSVVLIESLMAYLFGGERYLSLIDHKSLASTRHDLSMFELFSFNYVETKDRVVDFVYLFSNIYGFYPHEESWRPDVVYGLTAFEGIGVLSYLFALYFSFRVNYKIFVINVVFLVGNLVGLLHYLPYHRGELIEYIGQAQLIFIGLAFACLYYKVIQVVNNISKPSLRVTFYFGMLIAFSSFILAKYEATTSQIDSRSSRHNFVNELPAIEQFVNNLPVGTSVIIGDEFAFIMALSTITNRSFMLSDHMRKGSKKWSVPDDFPRPSGYIGKPMKSVKAGGKSYLLQCGNTANCGTKNLVGYDNLGRIIFSSINH